MELQDLIRQYKAIKPDPLWAKENKANLMAYHQQLFPSRAKGLDFYYLKLKPVLATFVILGVILTGSVGTIYAAKNSLPGQPLYLVKRLTEKVRLVAAFNKTDKNILRAELLNNRVKEAKVLALRLKEISDSDIKAVETEKNLVSIAKDIKSEINVLQKEIVSQAPAELVPDVTFDEGSLPIQDGKQVAEIILSEDLKKSLEETKELLAKKDLSTALTKTIEASKKLTVTEATSTPEMIESAPIESEIINSAPTESVPTTPVAPKTILKKNPGSIGSLPIKKIQQPEEDFKIIPIREGEISTGLIREK